MRRTPLKSGAPLKAAGFMRAERIDVRNPAKSQRIVPAFKQEMKPKGPHTKKCAICKTSFKPITPWAKACKPECAIAFVDRVNAKKKAKAQRQERAETKAKLKIRADWMREAQAAWNGYVRARDAGLPCCSCGAMPEQKLGGTMDCSHYRSRGSAPHLKFHLHNAAAACVKCNRFLGGNIAALRVGLINRIGLEKVLSVEQNNAPRRFDIEYLARIKKIFIKKAKRIA